MADYKAHLFQSLGNNKLNPNRMQCGRRMWANNHGTMAFKSKAFFEFWKSTNDSHVCQNCLAWYKENKMGA